MTQSPQPQSEQSSRQRSGRVSLFWLPWSHSSFPAQTKPSPQVAGSQVPKGPSGQSSVLMPLFFCIGVYLLKVSFDVNPTKCMIEDVELSCIIAEDHLFLR